MIIAVLTVTAHKMPKERTEGTALVAMIKNPATKATVVANSAVAL